MTKCPFLAKEAKGRFKDFDEVTDDYCTSAGSGRGCKFWKNGKCSMYHE